uniref:Uncharacterized protein n=1 Tax=Rhizophora mucronata TaxID=61149 RepID=A0A2P2J1S5_RHIMU
MLFWKLKELILDDLEMSCHWGIPFVNQCN